MALTLTVAMGCAAPLWAEGGVARAQLTRIEGTVKVQRGGSAPWLTVSSPAHKLLYGGDGVQTTQRSKCVILMDGAVISLGPATHVVIPGGGPGPRPGTARRVWAVVGKVFIWLVGGRQMELGSEAAVAAAEGTRFLVEVAEDDSMTLTVLEGNVSFYNDAGRVMVAAGYQSQAQPGQAPTRPMRVDVSGYIDWEASVESLWMGWEVRHQPRFSPDNLRGQFQRMGDPATDNAQDAVSRGDLLHDLGDAPGAEASYRKALATEPENPEALLGLGYSLLAQARVAEAEQTFRQAADAAPDSAAPLIGLAAAQASMVNDAAIESANATLARALTIAPDDPQALALQGLLAMRQ
ncbi:MAG TPA: tetratricopeptide repeat protein, partial [Armatimonadota bacterium]|nr:tetratricopeptide repeat protein [Armatimonadota bacterium]